MANYFYKGKEVRSRSDRDRDVKLSWAHTVTLKHTDINFRVTDSVATKLVSGLKCLFYSERLKILGLLTLEYRIWYKQGFLWYRYSPPPEKFFITTNDDQTRGHKFKIYKQHSKTNLRKHFSSQRIVDNWNSLSSNIVESPNVNILKTD